MRANVLFALIKHNTLQILRIDPHGEVPWRKKNFTLLQTFCLRIVLKHCIEVSKALDLLTFISVNFGFILRKIKVVVVVVDDDNSVQSPGRGEGGDGGRGGNMIFVSIRQSNIPCRP